MATNNLKNLIKSYKNYNYKNYNYKINDYGKNK